MFPLQDSKRILQLRGCNGKTVLGYSLCARDGVVKKQCHNEGDGRSG